MFKPQGNIVPPLKEEDASPADGSWDTAEEDFVRRIRRREFCFDREDLRNFNVSPPRPRKDALIGSVASDSALDVPLEQDTAGIGAGPHVSHEEYVAAGSWAAPSGTWKPGRKNVQKNLGYRYVGLAAYYGGFQKKKRVRGGGEKNINKTTSSSSSSTSGDSTLLDAEMYYLPATKGAQVSSLQKKKQPESDVSTSLVEESNFGEGSSSSSSLEDREKRTGITKSAASSAGCFGIPSHAPPKKGWAMQKHKKGEKLEKHSDEVDAVFDAKQPPSSVSDDDEEAFPVRVGNPLPLFHTSAHDIFPEQDFQDGPKRYGTMSIPAAAEHKEDSDVDEEWEPLTRGPVSLLANNAIQRAPEKSFELELQGSAPMPTKTQGRVAPMKGESDSESDAIGPKGKHGSRACTLEIKCDENGNPMEYRRKYPRAHSGKVFRVEYLLRSHLIKEEQAAAAAEARSRALSRSGSSSSSSSSTASTQRAKRALVTGGLGPPISGSHTGREATTVRGKRSKNGSLPCIPEEDGEEDVVQAASTKGRSGALVKHTTGGQEKRPDAFPQYSVYMLYTMQRYAKREAARALNKTTAPDQNARGDGGQKGKSGNTAAASKMNDSSTTPGASSSSSSSSTTLAVARTQMGSTSSPKQTKPETPGGLQASFLVAYNKRMNTHVFLPENDTRKKRRPFGITYKRRQPAGGADPTSSAALLEKKDRAPRVRGKYKKHGLGQATSLRRYLAAGAISSSSSKSSTSEAEVPSKFASMLVNIPRDGDSESPDPVPMFAGEGREGTPETKVYKRGPYKKRKRVEDGQLALEDAPVKESKGKRGPYMKRKKPLAVDDETTAVNASALVGGHDLGGENGGSFLDDAVGGGADNENMSGVTTSVMKRAPYTKRKKAVGADENGGSVLGVGGLEVEDGEFDDAEPGADGENNAAAAAAVSSQPSMKRASYMKRKQPAETAAASSSQPSMKRRPYMKRKKPFGFFENGSSGPEVGQIEDEEDACVNEAELGADNGAEAAATGAASVPTRWPYMKRKQPALDETPSTSVLPVRKMDAKRSSSAGGCSQRSGAQTSGKISKSVKIPMKIFKKSSKASVIKQARRSRG
ncbi:unnamed protein product [Amoebophrya sp. A25]|nr:unnamed protein product [Amoebophrya sp. A25]|eukprot:GSA25T00015234001.1